MTHLKRSHQLPKRVYVVHTNQRVFFIEIEVQNKYQAFRKAGILLRSHEIIHHISSSISAFFLNTENL
ncbi:hypothetical protein CN918_31790 [Priestia megaterium]|nr:hypothetical protein CN918_31790 [Priestia megaterium]